MGLGEERLFKSLVWDRYYSDFEFGCGIEFVFVLVFIFVV